MEQEQALAYKKRAARAGRASFDDSMYWSLQVLRQRQDLAEAVASRFEELLIDEAQDTSELQLACLKEISRTNRLQSLILIGDLEQSIYSFQGASPDLCWDLVNGRDLRVMELSENHRSSQRICDTASHFCGRSSPDQAVGSDADCDWSPELILYPPKEPSLAVRHFQVRLGVLGIDENDVAVLARGHTLVDEINGQALQVKCEARPLALGRAAWMVQAGATLTRSQVEGVERILTLVAWDVDSDQLEVDDRRRLRQATMSLLESLPPVEGSDLRAWIQSAAGLVGKEVAKLEGNPARKSGQMVRSNIDQEGIQAESVFQDAPMRLRAQTIHDVKGESRDAVLVVADRLRSTSKGAQAALWRRPLFGEDVETPEEAEELRIVFVALTRARRFCAVALPSDTDEETQAGFLAAGFTVSPDQ